MIAVQNISKTYPGSARKANNNITFDLKKGEILCIAGENGAGKTTLMKILAGLETPDAGEIFINGKKEIIDSPLTAKRLGIGMVHQHFMLFTDYTAAENVVMGMEPLKWKFFFDAKKADKIAQKIIDDHGFSVNASCKVKDLTLGEMQQLEICRFLYRNAQIIILDEPTSILTEQETSSLFNTLKSLVKGGKSIIFITHKLGEIKQISDRVAVIRRGELAAVRNLSEIDENEIARLMINDENENSAHPAGIPPRKDARTGDPVLAFENVTVTRHGQKRPLLDNVSFSVNEREILGFTGVGGNGLGVIEAVLGGFLHPASGKALHKGKDISALSIRALRNQGLAYVPADRLRVGSAADATIEENMIINKRHEFHKKKNETRNLCGSWVKNFNIDAPNLNERASALSGGNLQKLILAREINRLCDYIVFSEPSWGLDIKSSRFIMGEIAALRERGAAVILISTNLDEILTLSDRIIVMYKGGISGVFANKDGIKDEICRCMNSGEKR
ncbi:MAG: ABC transporter ATP-binding protein [Treponema sp.]|jgi:simple sugar transport system ATP-binding protein|nr:ABC transporter ATP-binding protein [Treponema sp.]